MQQHLEIEFKTLITKQEYDALIKEFELQNSIFSQTNYYFDTPALELMKKKTVLRIRKKDKYKLTKKEKGSNGNEETSIYLTDEEALNMLNNGFNASIINEPYYVKQITALTTLRCKCPYKDGTIFFDHSIYNNIEDYEIEYEANDYSTGKETFESFLKEHNLVQQETISKSKRAFNSIIK
ncbi:MAG: CYTH domain-containing protein [Acholeplasmatales bacterium]|nr:CYTH domain-containing protein [Acholeplasmatales bacterium]